MISCDLSHCRNKHGHTQGLTLPLSLSLQDWNPLQKHLLNNFCDKARIVKNKVTISLADASLVTPESGSEFHQKIPAYDNVLLKIGGSGMPNKHREIQPNHVRRNGIRVSIYNPAVYFGPRFSIEDLCYGVAL